MSTTAFRHNPPPISFPRRNIGTSTTTTTAMTNDRSRLSAQKTNRLESIPPIRESLSTNSINNKPSPTTPLSAQSPTTNTRGRSYSNTNEKASESSTTNTRGRSNTNTIVRSSMESSKRIYTFSNKPRELPQNTKKLHNNRLRSRVLSAPDENSFQISPRSKLDQQKPLSADGSLTPRSSDDNNHHSNKSIRSTKRDDQQKNSLNALMKEQKRSKVPEAVQKRRIILLFHRLSPRQETNPSPIYANHQIQQSSSIPPNHTGNISSKNLNSSKISKPLLTDSFNNLEPEIADSMQLAAILANIQSPEDWISNSTSPQHQQTPLNLERYDYVVSNPLDTATFKLSPRTLKPHEEIAARSRFSQYYRKEMQDSANAQIPPLMASVVTENNNTIGNSIGNGKTITFKVNPIDTIKKERSFDEVESDTSTMDNEQIQLCYDATLNGFYDPKTGLYYDLTSA